MEYSMATENAVNNLVRTVQTQLNNLLNMVDTQVPLISNEINNDVDEFNNALDALEQRDAELEVLVTRVKELESTHDENELMRIEAIAKADIENAQRRVRDLEITDLKKKIKEFIALNPSRISQKNKELVKEIKSLKEQVKNIDGQFKVKRAGLIKSRSEVAKLAGDLVTSGEEKNALQVKVDFINGYAEPKPFKGGSGLEFYIHMFEWGLRVQPVNPSHRSKMMPTLDWHIEVRSNVGVNVTCGITDWCQPFFPLCSEYNNNFPSDIYEAIEDIVVDRIEGKYPKIAARLLWAKSVCINDIDTLTKKQKKLLEQLNDDKLLAIVTASVDKLANSVKGLSAVGAGEIVDAVIKFTDREYPIC
jgi:hypothetical protein